MNKVAMMQPTFLPWIGYFELIYKSDIFVFCDDFQFVSKSYHQKNKLFLSKNVVTDITVPVQKKGNYGKNINEIEIREDLDWRKKFWKGFELNYKKAPFFEEYSRILKPLLVEPQYNLAKQNIALITAIADIIGLKRKFICSSELHGTGTKSNLVKSLLEEINADEFYQAHGSFDYMYEDGVFPLDNIHTYFQNAELDAYPQQSSTKGFVPYLSIVDALFNVGAEATLELVKKTTKHWLSWDEIVTLEKGKDAL